MDTENKKNNKKETIHATTETSPQSTKKSGKFGSKKIAVFALIVLAIFISVMAVITQENMFNYAWALGGVVLIILYILFIRK